MSYRDGNAWDRARKARLAAYRMSAGTDEAWLRRWRWKNEWVEAMAADKARADPRLVEIWKGEPPHG